MSLEVVNSQKSSNSSESKLGLFKSIQSRILRAGRTKDDNEHGFLQPGPFTVAKGRRKSCDGQTICSTPPNFPSHQHVPLQARRSIPCPLTLPPPNFPSHQHVPLQARRSIPCPLTLPPPSYAQNPPRIVRRTQSSPISDAPPKIPERSPVSLGLVSPRAINSVKTRNGASLFDPSPRSTKPLPPIPIEEEVEEPPEEIAPPVPDCQQDIVPVVSENIMYLPTDEISPVTRELMNLSKYGYYWGPISRTEAENRLEGRPDGTFLLRNSVDKRFLLSLSFRSLGRTLHARIEHCEGRWSFSPRLNDETFMSVSELINDAMRKPTVCYSRNSRDPDSPTFPVRIHQPINRFAEVRSLAYLCRFVIRLHIRQDYLEQISLPERIRQFLA